MHVVQVRFYFLSRLHEPNIVGKILANKSRESWPHDTFSFKFVLMLRSSWKFISRVELSSISKVQVKGENKVQFGGEPFGSFMPFLQPYFSSSHCSHCFLLSFKSLSSFESSSSSITLEKLRHKTCDLLEHWSFLVHNADDVRSLALESSGAFSCQSIFLSFHPSNINSGFRRFPYQQSSFSTLPLCS